MKALRFLTLGVVLVASVATSVAATLKGKVIDETTQQPLIGATILIKGTAQGVTTNFDGEFELKVDRKPQTIAISYVSYVTQELQVEGKASKGDILVKLAADTKVMDAVKVTTRVSKESEFALQNERIASNVAIENLGAKEMSIKGISNVEEGVKKITGISVADAGQLFVRGLGDRYSTTTLNGLPIASPNPDNKLIPLDIFPSSVVKNITVSKVYNAQAYADYAGAHIDIATKDLASDDFFTFGVSVGGDVNTVGQDFYSMDNVSMLSKAKLDETVLDSSLDYSDYSKTNNPFDTTFDIEQKTALPSFGVNAGYGHTFKVGSQKLGVLASVSVKSDNTKLEDTMERKITSTGNITDEFVGDEYESTLDITALANVGMSMRESDRVSYTVLYARNASNKYMERRGHTYDRNNLVTVNNVSRIYSLLTQQLAGAHDFNDKFDLNWKAGYTMTSSDEPDRRELIFKESAAGYSLDAEDDTTMRFFSELDENELDADINSVYKMSDDNKFTLGVAYKNKARDFGSRFFTAQAIGNMGVVMDDIYSSEALLGIDQIVNGNVVVTRDIAISNNYKSGSDVISAYAVADFKPVDKFFVNLGVRLENSVQSVDYAKEGSRVIRTNELKSLDFFPAANLKYAFDKKNQLRLSASRTITRPSFIEMANFKYQEALGGATVRGNVDIENGYNYNFDLRYERFFDSGDMFSVSGYYKFLDNPIERVQEIEGEDSVIQTFENITQGTAAGVEFEFKKKLVEGLRLGVNGSYMFTNVSLSGDDSARYTNKDRMLQGASPLLINADLTYGLNTGDDKMLNLALLYNYQGERIYAVGLDGFGDIMQHAVNTLNFVASYAISEKCSIKLELSDLINSEEIFDQTLPNSSESVVVKSYDPGMGAEIGVSFKF